MVTNTTMEIARPLAQTVCPKTDPDTFSIQNYFPRSSECIHDHVRARANAKCTLPVTIDIDIDRVGELNLVCFVCLFLWVKARCASFCAWLCCNLPSLTCGPIMTLNASVPSIPIQLLSHGKSLTFSLSP